MGTCAGAGFFVCAALRLAPSGLAHLGAWAARIGSGDPPATLNREGPFALLSDLGLASLLLTPALLLAAATELRL